MWLLAAGLSPALVRLLLLSPLFVFVLGSDGSPTPVFVL
jgi:hypothetical protein